MLRAPLITVLLVLTASATLASDKFPDNPTPCHFGDSECIASRIQYFLSEKVQGDGSINLISLDPLMVTKIQIKQGQESPVAIDLIFKDNIVSGIHHPSSVAVKGFGENLADKHELIFKFAEVGLSGKYSINGKVLILPISGEGNSNITMYKPELKLHFRGTPVEKDGAVYMGISHTKCNIQPESLHFYFENLFNGDKVLGDNMNKFLNENWKDIYGEVRKSLEEAFGKIFESILTNVFAKRPYAEFFLH